MNLDKLSLSDLTELRSELQKQNQIRLAFIIDATEYPIYKMIGDVDIAITKKIIDILRPE